MMKRSRDIPENIYNDEVVLFLAERYHTAPEEVLRRYFEQDDHSPKAGAKPFRPEENEMAILRDMLSGEIEFKRQKKDM